MIAGNVDKDGDIPDFIDLLIIYTSLCYTSLNLMPWAEAGEGRKPKLDRTHRSVAGNVAPKPRGVKTVLCR